MKIKEVNKKSFVIFPLYTLRLNVGLTFLINCIIDYFIISVLKEKYSEKKLIYYFKGYTFPEYPEEKTVIMLEYKYLQKRIRGYPLNNFNYSFLRYRIIKLNNIKYVKWYGKNDAKVMLYLNLLTDILDKNVLQESQFRVLCAIFSVLGKNKNPKSITNSIINYRVNGLMNKAIADLEISKTKRTIYTYKNRTLKKIIDSLGDGVLGRHFFARRRDGRQYYYSKYLRGKELEIYVARLKLKNKAVQSESRINEENVKKHYHELANKKRLSENEMNMIFKLILASRNDKLSFFNQIKKTIRNVRKSNHK